MAYKIWAVVPPQGESPTPVPQEAFIIDAADAESAQEWLAANGFEDYSVNKEVTALTGGGGPVRPTSSGGRPVL